VDGCVTTPPFAQRIPTAVVKKQPMLRSQIDQLAEEAGAHAIALSTYDYATEAAWGLRGARHFHAASTIKVAVMYGLFAAIDAGRLPLDGELHVRNRFTSAADGALFRVEPERDANAEVFAARGRTMPLTELARHMIQTSSNLATNLLVDLLGAETIQATLHDHDISGLSIVRGVEDERAWEAGINNTVSADGLVRLFRVIQEGTLSDDSSGRMREVLLGQQFRTGIPDGVPEDVRESAEFAHKTGEISTVAHDAGLVYLPDRAPYVIAILSEWPSDAPTDRRRALLSNVSRTVYHLMTEPETVDG